MKLVSLQHRYDFGHDWYVQILNTGRHVPKPFKDKSLLQISVSWSDYGSWPYLQITMGSGGLIGFLFWVHKFGLAVDVFSRTWNFDYIDNLDQEENV